MIRANFNVKKIKQNKEDDEQRELEEIIAKVGAGSHMVFRSKKKNDELFVDEL